MNQVLFYPDKRLRNKSVCVQDAEWGSSLKRFIENLYRIMDVSQGIGLAAPQIGVHKKVLVYKTFGEEKEEYRYLINPRIVEKKGQATVNEGCLSLPGVFAEVERFSEIEVESRTFEGDSFTFKTNTFSSIIIQHETDHLYGKLFIDKLSESQRKILLDEYMKSKKA